MSAITPQHSSHSTNAASSTMHCKTIHNLDIFLLVKIFKSIHPSDRFASFRSIALVSKDWKHCIEITKSELWEDLLNTLTNCPKTKNLYLNKLQEKPYEYLYYVAWRIEKAIGLPSEPQTSIIAGSFRAPNEQFSVELLGDAAVKFNADRRDEFAALGFPPRPRVRITREEFFITLLSSLLPHLNSHRVKFRGHNLATKVSRYLRKLPQNLKSNGSLLWAQALGFEKVIQRAKNDGQTFSLADIDWLLDKRNFFLLRQLRGSSCLPSLNDWHWCAICGTVDELNALPSNNVMMHSSVENGRTPLHYAAQRGDLNIVKALIARGAHPNAHVEIHIDIPIHDTIGISLKITPFIVAIVKGHIECAEWLQTDTEISIENSTPYWRFREDEHERQEFFQGMVPLPILAALVCESPFINDILDQNEDFATREMYERTIRLASSMRCSTPFFEELCTFRGNLVTNGQILLKSALKVNSLNVARAVLEGGSVAPNEFFMRQPHKRNTLKYMLGECSTPMTYARTPEMRALLEQYGGVRHVDTVYRVGFRAMFALDLVFYFAALTAVLSLKTTFSFYTSTMKTITEVTVVTAFFAMFMGALVLAHNLLHSRQRNVQGRRQLGNAIARGLRIVHLV